MKLLWERYNGEFTLDVAYGLMIETGFETKGGVRSTISKWTNNGLSTSLENSTYKLTDKAIVKEPKDTKKTTVVSIPVKELKDVPGNEFHNLINHYTTICGRNKYKPIGYAGEDLVAKMNCLRCNKNCNKKMPENNKGYDIICRNCKQKTQVKTSKRATIKNNMLRNVTGALYSATVETFDQDIDYICIKYTFVDDVYTIDKCYYTKFESMQLSDIKKTSLNRCTLNLFIDDIIKI